MTSADLIFKEIERDLSRRLQRAERETATPRGHDGHYTHVDGVVWLSPFIFQTLSLRSMVYSAKSQICLEN